MMNWPVFIVALAWIFGGLNVVIALGSGIAVVEAGVKRGPWRLFLVAFSAAAVCVAVIVAQ